MTPRFSQPGLRRNLGGALAAFVTVLVACGGCAGPGSRQAPGDLLAAPVRAIRIEAHSVVIEGRWHPEEATADSPVVPNSVRAVCTRAERQCREELTTAPPGKGPVVETFDYKVSEWTNAKLVATRRQDSSELQLRVSLTGLAAEKLSRNTKGDRDAGVRWRLE